MMAWVMPVGSKENMGRKYLAAMTASCTMEIKSVPGVKNMLFGGEGVFNTVLTGPGKVWLQTMPISNVAGVLSPYFPSSSN